MVVDAMRQRLRVHGVVGGGECATAIQERMGTARVNEKADNLAKIVDAEWKGATPRQRIVDGGVAAVAGIVDEPMGAGGIAVRSDNLAGAVNALCKGVAAGGRGI